MDSKEESEKSWVCTSGNVGGRGGGEGGEGEGEGEGEGAGEIVPRASEGVGESWSSE